MTKTFAFIIEDLVRDYGEDAPIQSECSYNQEARPSVTYDSGNVVALIPYKCNLQVKEASSKKFKELIKMTFMLEIISSG